MPQVTEKQGHHCVQTREHMAFPWYLSTSPLATKPDTRQTQSTAASMQNGATQKALSSCGSVQDKGSWTDRS